MNKTLSKGMPYKTNVVKTIFLKILLMRRSLVLLRKEMFSFYFLRKEKKESFAIRYENDINRRF